ncbi:lipoamide acyltransferase component of branched-chain alpha-keto acid dehydrogenase complex [Massilia varians]|uniref:Dihydrolipoamide acetyltransferase component of pyruvate dehydrogenase complex n=1 Tax=Massilia varians TaxID=457921 RepID=A0ABM8C809_9BURK|nr:dihydrolipoamide acetyltransferase family protein [Massilia varians]BDT59347.1 lipoamide acyltransferase component of branched-chain alpha-keto acid dehydrogenase complex [Massilia varians]
MGIHVIKMPDLGEGIAEVEVVAWHVQPGDTVKEDQVLADVMTDKATVEIPSPVAGTITSLGGAVGQSLAVGAELIRLDVEGAGNFSGEKAKQEPVKSAAATAPAEEVAEPQLEAVAQAEATQGASAKAAAPAAPAPRAAAPQARSYQNGPAPMRADGEKPLAAPAVRQRAWDLGIELQFVHGSGPAGRILHSDLDAHVAGRRASAPGAGRDERYAKRDGEQSAPVIGLRRKIAEKMQEAKRNIPHFTYVEEVDVTELEALRTQLNARYGAERGKLTFLPLLMRAVVLALRQYPMMNARYDDANNLLTQFEGVHLGIAAQTEAGLMVPVVRHAETLDPWAAAAEVARLADAARAGRATREELTGSTITITSLGPLGGIVTTPVLNRPEVAIIGPNRIVDRPMIRDGAMVARKMMNLSSSFDHRVIDGQVAAKFVQTIRGYLETPATIFVE